jgi:phosphoglycolate phosphatase-like HAD superfamily hydrolase
MKILLFDIDGTLIHTGGSGKHAMEAAFEEIYGMPGGLENVLLMGKPIRRFCWRRFKNIIWRGRTSKLNDSKSAILFILPRTMQRPRPKRLMPASRNCWKNCKNARNPSRLAHRQLIRGAEIKLEYFDLWQYFEFGAFGDDEVDRNKLVPHALRRAEEKFGVRPQQDRMYVIGDTPRDIYCARPHGAITVAVATGEYSIEELRSEGPDFLFKDFSEMEKVLRIFQ